MKKIGILSFHRANNYGAVLQNYALQQSIKKMGYTSETIDYIIPRFEKEYKVRKIVLKRNIKDCFVANFWNALNYKNAKIQYKKYEQFREKYLSISMTPVTKESIGDTSYDIYISGSDQVWNECIVGSNDIRTFTLAFTNSKRASYAASCGNIEVLDNLEDIKNFDYITVREDDLSIELTRVGIANRVVCDPTILLTKSEWLRLLKHTTSDHEKYVYLYYIDSGKNEAAKIAKAVAQEKKMDVYYSKKYDMDAFLNKYGVNSYSDGPLDFINEIRCAEYVVVSSFHGVVFSILMEKEFVALLHEQTGSRVVSLLNKLGLSDRIVKDYEDFKSKIFNPINYGLVNTVVDAWRTESLNELRKICEL